MPNQTQTPTRLWTPSLGTTILDECVDNALRRISANVGFSVSMDKGHKRTMRDMADPDGVEFFRVGDSLDPKEVEAGILREFYAEAVPAFRAAKAALAAEALAYIKGREVDKAQSRVVLATADGAFTIPEKDIFTKEGLPFAKTIAKPSTQAFIGGIAGFLCMFALVRSPHLGIFSGVLIGGAAYYLARRSMYRHCEELLRLLPRNLYQMLVAEWNANINRYADAVNAGLQNANEATLLRMKSSRVE